MASRLIFLFYYFLFLLVIVVIVANLHVSVEWMACAPAYGAQRTQTTHQRRMSNAPAQIGRMKPTNKIINVPY